MIGDRKKRLWLIRKKESNNQLEEGEGRAEIVLPFLSLKSTSLLFFNFYPSMQHFKG